MTKGLPTGTNVSCACGSVVIEALGAPITSVSCYCDDCQEGARQIEALPGAPAVQDPDGGTAYLVYRKDRVRFSKGASLTRNLKIKDKSATNRVAATCCNSAMLLNFDDGKHWVDLYRSRCLGDVMPLQMRICTKFKPANGDIPNDVPCHSRYPMFFVMKLLVAKAAMMFNR